MFFSSFAYPRVLALASGYDTLTLRLIIWGVIGGLAVGTLISLFGRRIPGVLVRELHRAGADCAEKAVTLDELGLKKNFLLRRALRDGTPLRKYALLANEADFVTKEPKKKGFGRVMRKIFSLPPAQAKRILDFDRARFYMPDEQRYVAEVRYNGKGATLTGVVLSLLLLLGIGFLLQWLLPDLISAFRGIIS